MKSLLIKMAIGFALAYGGFKLLDIGFNSTTAETVQKYEGLCKNSMETLGYYDSTYLVMKVVGAKVSTINFKYAVDGTFFNGSHTLEGPEGPAAKTVRVWYDSENPSSYSTDEPCAQLAAQKKKYKLPPLVFLISGAILLLIGFVNVRSAFINMIRGAIKTARGK